MQVRLRLSGRGHAARDTRRRGPARRAAAVATAAALSLTGLVAPAQATGVLQARPRAGAASAAQAGAAHASAAQAGSSAARARVRSTKSRTAGGAQPVAVPGPTSTRSVVTVKVGGDRTGAGTVGNLQGVTLRLFHDNGGAGGASGAPGTALSETWATCTSDADGDCSFVVRNTGSGGEYNKKRLWVKQVDAPSGWSMNSTLATGTSPASTAYAFRTPELVASQTYRSTADFMNNETGARTSSGTWQNSRTNPGFPNSCGMDVALAIDLSRSVGSALPDLKNAAKSLVDALTGTPSRVALFTFATTAPAAPNTNLARTSVSTPGGANTVKDRIDTYELGTYTNWDRGLYQIVTGSADKKFDLVIVLTDGNPTVYGANSGSSTTRFAEIEHGIFSANALKAMGTRVVAMGVGAGVSGPADNLKAISGPTKNSDYYQASTYADAANVMRELAQAKCKGKVSIVKQIVPSTAVGEDISRVTPGGGWEFTVTTSTPGVGPASQTGTTEADTGAVNLPLTWPAGLTTAPTKIVEEAQEDFDLMTIGGKRAVCTNILTGAALTVTNDAANPLGFSVPTSNGTAVSCQVYNKAKVPKANIAVTKKWVIDGVTYAEGGQPAGMTAALTLDGSALAWGNRRGDLPVDTPVKIDETASVAGRPLCTLQSKRITEHNGAAVDLALPATVTLPRGRNDYVITNTVTCGSRLTLVKQVGGGSAAATDWTLSAIAPGGALAGPSGATGSAAATGTVTPDVPYVLTESGNGHYRQMVAEGQTPVAGSSGSWTCREVDEWGNVIPGFDDGAEGTVTVPIGHRVRCSAMNETARLKLIKHVTNDSGGTKQPADWTLTATPSGTRPADVGAQSVPGSWAGETIEVRPGTPYALSESGPGGYEQTSIRCNTGVGGASEDRTSVTLAPLDNVECVIANNDKPARLTLIKEVDNGTTQASYTARDWSLHASGPSGISGRTGDSSITSAQVMQGTYTLTENGPSGYTSAWSCTGATLETGTKITLAGGDNATCRLRNTAVAPKLTLIKRVDNTYGGTRSAADFTLQATRAGAPILSGVTGDAAVTSVSVPVGEYVLSEVNPDPTGYDLSAVSCVVDGNPTGTNVWWPNVTLGLGSVAVCTFTNQDKPAKLTLRKSVDAGYTGSPAAAGDWTLTATPNAITGQSAVSGNGSNGVVEVPVKAGQYTLGESGPAGFDAGSWACTGGTVASGVVSVPAGANVVCTITNTARGSRLTLRKVVTNSNGGARTAAEFTLKASLGGTERLSGAGGAPEVTNVAVPVGEYTLSEINPDPAGYELDALSCTDRGSPMSGPSAADPKVTVGLDADVVCTFTNIDKPARLTLKKVVRVGTTGATHTPANWTLTATPDSIPGQPMVSGDGTGSGSGAVDAVAVKAGKYTLTESGPSGYTAATWDCTGATVTPAGVVTVPSGKSVVCEITNTANGPRLTLAKTVTNSHGGTLTEDDFTLKASRGGSDVLTGRTGLAAVTGRAVPIGTYTLSETNPDADGYELASLTCTNNGAALTGPSAASPEVTLSLGDDVLCTFANRDKPATLTLVKELENGTTGAAHLIGEWTLTAAGPTPVSGHSGDAPVTAATVDRGSYTLGETGPAGYASSWSCTGAVVVGTALTLPGGAVATCTARNTAIGPRLTLVKTVHNDNGGALAADDFTLTATKGGVGYLSGATGSVGVTDVRVPIGAYTLAETPDDTGYRLDLACTNRGTSIPGVDADHPTVSLALNDDVTCTFENRDQPAELTLLKRVQAAGSGTAKVPADWTVTATPIGITGQGVVTGDGSGVAPAGVAATSVKSGRYRLSESGPAGFTAGAWSCTGAVLTDDVVTVTSNARVECSITNTAIAPKLTLVKALTKSHGGTATKTDFTLKATRAGTDWLSGATESPAVTGIAVPVGSYALSEISPEPAGYELSSLTCTNHGAAMTGPAKDAPTVTLTEGADVTCTFANRDKPAKLTLVKSVENGTTGATHDADEWTLSADGPTDISGRTGATSVTAAEVDRGEYTLDESGPAGYASFWSCAGGNPLVGQTIELAGGDDVTCTAENIAIKPKLTLVKTVTNTNGGSRTAAEFTLTATRGTDELLRGATTEPAVTAVPVPIGSYDLAEISPEPTGYELTSLSCTNDGSAMTGPSAANPKVTLGLGDDVVCTFANTDKPAALTLRKVVDLGESGAGHTSADWTLSATPISISGQPVVTGDGTGTAPDGVFGTTVKSGRYTLAESGPAGFDAGAWTCSGGVVAADVVTVPGGAEVVCTITNTARSPRLTLVKTVTNDHGGGRLNTEFTLTATRAGTEVLRGVTGTPVVTSVPVKVGTYTLAEVKPEVGYELTSLTCTNDGSPMTGPSATTPEVTLGVGDNVVCTFANRDRPATISLRKTVTLGSTGATHTPADWELTAVPDAITGQPSVTGDGSGTSPDGVVDVVVKSGQYTLIEDGPDGYQPGDWDCTGGEVVGDVVTVASGAKVQCTITNTAIAPRLTLVKTVTNPNGGSRAATEFPLSATSGATVVSGVTGTAAVTNQAVPIGSYTLAETNPDPAGYELTSLSCVKDGSAVAGTNVANPQVALALGDRVTCTFANRDRPATLTLRKYVEAAGSGTPHTGADWTVTATPIGIPGQAVVTGDGSGTGPGGVDDVSVKSGQYTLSESAGPAGFTAGDWDCSGASLVGDVVTVPGGRDVVCTITNTATAPKLTLVKEVTNTRGGERTATEFTLKATRGGTDILAGVTGTTAVTKRPVAIGSYALSEISPEAAGYELSSLSCENKGTAMVGPGVGNPTVTLALGDDVECTFANRDKPAKLTLVKSVENGTTGATHDADEWTLSADGPTDISGRTGATSVTAAEVDRGEYTLDESGPAGYASFWSCVGGNPLVGQTIELAGGDDVTCTAENIAIKPKLTLVKTVTNTNGGSLIAAQFPLRATHGGSDLLSGATGTPGVTEVAVPIGAYALAETNPDPTGYTLDALTCTDRGAAMAGPSVADPNVTLALGADVTCTFANTDRPASLTLRKVVDAGATGTTRTGADWTLTATPQSIAGQAVVSGDGSGTNPTGVVDVSVKAGHYALSESGPAGFDPGAWTCTGAVVSALGVVSVPGGGEVECTITNTARQAYLTLAKTVVNNNGGSLVAADFILTAKRGGAAVVSGAAGSAAVDRVAVPIGSYTVGEVNPDPAGYGLTDLSCVDRGVPIAGPDVAGPTVEVGLGADITCTLTNSDRPGTLSLRKVVDVGTTGATHTPADWTLTATPQSITGQLPVSGDGTGTSPAGVHNVTVNSGDYALTETGPGGYDASAWTCTGGTVSAAGVVTVPSGVDVACTITNTAKSPKLTLVKTVTRTHGGPLTAADFTLEARGAGAVLSGKTGTADVTNKSVPVGTYTLSELNPEPAGYELDSLTCTDRGVPIAGPSATSPTVTIGLDSDIECTFANRDKPAKLTLRKTVEHGSTGATHTAAEWTLFAHGDTPISGHTGDPAITAAEVSRGTYTLDEDGPDGYAFSWICTGATLVGDEITLTGGDEATCTARNTAISPRLTLVKSVTNVAGGLRPASDFTLKATAGGVDVLSGKTATAAVTEVPVPIGTYDLSEDNPDPLGYELTSLSCAEGITPVPGVGTLNPTLNLALGQRITCTFVNRDRPATLSLRKFVDPGGTGSTATPAEWTLTATPNGIDGQAAVTGDGSGDPLTGVVDAVVKSGRYTLSETGPAGFTAGDWDCSGGATVAGAVVTVPGGRDVVCTITNTAVSPKLTLVKTVTNSHGGTRTEAEFALQARRGIGVPIVGATGSPTVTGAAVPIGTYTLSETGPEPTGYELSELSCTNRGAPIVGPTAANPEVTLALGADVTCTFANRDKPAKLTLVKVVDNGATGASKVAADWTLTASNGPVTITGHSGDAAISAASVPRGTYTLGESGPAGYTASWACTGPGGTFADPSVTLANGADVTCTVTNTAKLSRLTLIKTVANTQGGSRPASDFTLTAALGGTEWLRGETGEPAVTDVVVPIGNFDLAEVNPDPIGYELASLSCTDGGTPLSGPSLSHPIVPVGLGSNVVCTFANRDKPGKLTLIKEVDPAATGSTRQPAAWTLTATPDAAITGQPVVTGNGSGANPGGVVAVTVKSGPYTLTESGPAGFDPGSWRCEGGAVTAGGVVTVPGGGNVICRITNTARSPKLTLVKIVVNGTTGGNATTADWTLMAAGPTPIGGTSGATTVTAADVKVGTYALSEVGTAVGYTASAWTCAGGGRLTGANLTLAEGENVTCTITNTARTPRWNVRKAADPASGSTVVKGQTITYTVTIQRTDGVFPTSVEVRDDITDVLAHATLTGPISTTTGTAAQAGNEIVWTVGTLTGVETLTYSVVVGEVYGEQLRNVVAVPPGATCGGSCVTTHETPNWSVAKSADPPSGEAVDEGDLVTYTLRATNHGVVPVSGALVTDDLSDVLDQATLIEPLPARLTFNAGTQILTWRVPRLGIGGSASVSYQVRVHAQVEKDSRTSNVAVPTSSGGRCITAVPGATPDPAAPDCDTVHRIGWYNLKLLKSHAALRGGGIEPLAGKEITYTLRIVNESTEPTHDVVVTDRLPAGVAYVDGSFSGPPGWSATVTGDELVATLGPPLPVGADLELTFRVRVTALPTVKGEYDPVENRACVTTSNQDADPANDCDTDPVPVLTVQARALGLTCAAGAPLLTYSITPRGFLDPPSVTVIWWPKATFAKRDATIDAGDLAALRADGAAHFYQVPVPAGWTAGTVLAGRTAWAPATTPGFADLVVEIRVNAMSTPVKALVANPTSCGLDPGLDPNHDPDPPLAVTGGESLGIALLGALLILGGAALAAFGRRRDTGR